MEVQWLSGKVKVSGKAVSKEGHILLKPEKTKTKTKTSVLTDFVSFCRFRGDFNSLKPICRLEKKLLSISGVATFYSSTKKVK